jgi:hypothetical protein
MAITGGRVSTIGGNFKALEFAADTSRWRSCASGQLPRFAVPPGAPGKPMPTLISPVPARHFDRSPAWHKQSRDEFLFPILLAFIHRQVYDLSDGA